MNIHPINACDKYLMGFLLHLNLTTYINILNRNQIMKTENQKPTNVTIPAGTAELLKEMFTSHNGVDMTNVINDLSTNDNNTIVTINLGLLLNGKVLKVPETMYSLSKDRDGNVTRVYIYKKTNHSLLKDRVYYKRYQFNYKTAEDGTQSWVQDSWVNDDQCSVCRWFDLDKNLPEDIVLPEIVDKD